jgi:Signal peptidase, peptidase S26
MRPRALILIALGAAALVVAHRRLDVVEVRGHSMAPTLLPGDRLLVGRARPRLGDVVLAPDPRHPTRELIKRVVATDDAGIALAGDNAPGSTDAIVDPDTVRWRAVLRTWPPSRAGAVRRRPPPPLSDRTDERRPIPPLHTPTSGRSEAGTGHERRSLHRWRRSAARRGSISRS